MWGGTAFGFEIWNTKASQTKKQEKNGNKVLFSNQISSSSCAGSAGRPSLLSLPSHPPFLLGPSLYLPLWYSLSLHPLSERHTEAVGSLRRVWGSARAVRGCYLGLLQQTGSSSLEGWGGSRETVTLSSAQHSSAQHSTARLEPGLHSSWEGKRETPALAGKDSRETEWQIEITGKAADPASCCCSSLSLLQWVTWAVEAGQDAGRTEGS